MKKHLFRVCTLLIMSLCPHLLWAQELSQLDYWFEGHYDARRSVTLNGERQDLTLDIPADELPDGMHKLYLRLKDSEGGYSGVSTSYFWKHNTSDLSGATLEYWVDNDEEHRKTIAGTPADGGLYFAEGDIDLSRLKAGLHKLYLRVKDSQGGYSGVSTSYFWKHNTSDLSGATLEYWVDNDLEHRKTIAGTPADGGLYFAEGDIDLSSLKAGLHKLYLRVKDSQGGYSNISMSYIWKYDNTDLSGMKLEYWFDDDYAHHGTIEAETYGSVSMADGEVDASHMKAGLHKLNCRFTSDSHRYSSHIISSLVFVMPREDYFMRYDQPTIMGGRYWVDDMEPQDFPHFEPGEAIELDELVNLASLEGGQHTLFMQFIDSNGHWTDIDRTVFTKVILDGSQTTIAGIIYEYVGSKGEPFVIVVGYDDDLQKADILSSVPFGGDDVEVKAIETNAFNGAGRMDEIVRMPATIQAIGENAFAATPVSEVNLNATTSPAISGNAFPAGTNIRVPIGANGYDAERQRFDDEDWLLTYDLGCIYDSQWEALKRIDAMVRAEGDETGWDFSDRRATPAGVSRLGTDHVLDIDLSNHDMKGSYESDKWTDGLPRLRSINLTGNSITDMTNSDKYSVLRLDHQQYDYVLDIYAPRYDATQLLQPEIPLIFRHADNGQLGNAKTQTLTYRLSTKTLDGTLLGESQEEYAMLLSVNQRGAVKMAQATGNRTNVYREKSGQELCVTASDIPTITSGSSFRSHLFYEEGDVDLNGSIDITDLQKIINYIFDTGSTSHIFAWHAANLASDDDVINVQDVVGEVGALLSQTSGGEKRISRRQVQGVADQDDDQQDTPYACLTITDEGLAISSGQDVAALDLIVSQGIDFSELTRLGFIISKAAMANGKERVIAYSLSGAVIPAGEYTIATNTVGKTVSEALLADIDSNPIPSYISNDATCIRVVDSDSDDANPRYDLSGRRVGKGYRGVTIQKGRISAR